MEKRIAILGIIVENPQAVAQINALLHEFGSGILGRMGVPVREQGVSVISVALCAPMNVISALSGRLGRLEGVNARVTYSGVTVPA